MEYLPCVLIWIISLIRSIALIFYEYKWLLSQHHHNTFHRFLHCMYKASPLCPRKYSSLFFSGEYSSLNVKISHRLRSLDSWSPFG